MRAYVDKVEGGLAELWLGEDEAKRVTLPVAVLPKGVREGDVLKVSFERDEAATREGMAAIDEQRKKLLERSKDEPF